MYKSDLAGSLGLKMVHKVYLVRFRLQNLKEMDENFAKVVEKMQKVAKDGGIGI